MSSGTGLRILRDRLLQSRVERGRSNPHCILSESAWQRVSLKSRFNDSALILGLKSRHRARHSGL